MKHSPRIILRRLWDRPGYGLWLVVEENGKYRYAKPVEINLEESQDPAYPAIPPDPTLFIPAEQIRQMYKEFVEQLEMEGETVTEFKQVVKAKDQNLSDLREVVSKLLSKF